MKTKRLYLVLIAIILVLTGACKLTLRHEIWLDDESSGSVEISAEAEWDREPGSPPDSSMTEENPLQDYVDFAEEFMDLEIVDSSIEDLSTDYTYRYLYTIKADFGDFEELGYWLGVKDEAGIEQEFAEDGTVIRIYPARNEMLSMGRLEDELDDLEYINIYSEYSVHTPRPMLYATDADWLSEDKKSASWEDTIDYDFYTSEEIVYELKY